MASADNDTPRERPNGSAQPVRPAAAPTPNADLVGRYRTALEQILELETDQHGWADPDCEIICIAQAALALNGSLSGGEDAR